MLEAVLSRQERGRTFPILAEPIDFRCRRLPKFLFCEGNPPRAAPISGGFAANGLPRGARRR